MIPLLGNLLFIVLYYIATFFYPGGSAEHPHAIGFSWQHNYWCNLLNDTAINGMHNAARPVAIAAMIILSIGVSFFWLLFPIETGFNNFSKKLIQISGMAAMIITFFLLSGYMHDLIINIACILGLISIVGTFKGLWNLKLKSYFIAGLVNIILIIINNILYYNSSLIHYLAIVQKITFLYFLSWISAICINRLLKKSHPFTN